MVDAHGSGPCALRVVEVQVLSSASECLPLGSPELLEERPVVALDLAARAQVLDVLLHLVLANVMQEGAVDAARTR